MPTNLKSSHVQQNFGLVMDRALTDGEVIVERYGKPRVVIVEYERYRRLLEAERSLLRDRLRRASDAASARAASLNDAAIDDLIEEGRAAVYQADNDEAQAT